MQLHRFAMRFSASASMLIISLLYCECAGCSSGNNCPKGAFRRKYEIIEYYAIEHNTFNEKALIISDRNEFPVMNCVSEFSIH